MWWIKQDLKGKFSILKMFKMKKIVINPESTPSLQNSGHISPASNEMHKHKGEIVNFKYQSICML